MALSLAIVAQASGASAGIRPAVPAGDLVAGAVSGELQSVAVVSVRSAWAVGGTEAGTPLILHWNGRTWRRMAGAVLSGGGTLTGVAAISTRDAWAVGAANGGAVLLERWNGRSWKRIRSPVSRGALTGVAAASAGDAWAVGSTETGKPLTLRWNGRSWKQQPIARPVGAVLSGVAVVSRRDVWVVGSQGGGALALIEHWNGAAWKIVRAPRPAGGSELFSVTAVSPSNAWAVGTSDVLAGVGGAALIEHWNGKVWRQARAPRGGAGLQAVTALSATRAWAAGGTNLEGIAASSAANAWAVGTYQDAAGPRILIEHWNGKTWTT